MDKELKTSLTIKLYAGEVLVAESSDAAIWQRVLAAVTSGKGEEVGVVGTGDLPPLTDSVGGNNQLDGFAQELELDSSLVQGALDPTDETPFLHLDTVTWEAFKRNFPARGPNSVPAIVMAMTALALWFRSAGLGTATTSQAQAVLATIHVSGPNPSRSIKNCPWLQQKSGGVVINPAENSRAVSVVKAFCSKQGPE